MEDCFIRKAQLDDYENVEAIMKQVQQLHITWRPDIYQEVDVVLPFEEFVQLVNQEVFFVAEMDSHIVGILSYVCRHIESDKQVTRDVLFIDCLAVKEEYRGKGIGHRMLDYMKSIVKEKNFDGLELQVNAKNISAKRMYEKYGFREKSINMELI